MNKSNLKTDPTHMLLTLFIAALIVVAGISSTVFTMKIDNTHQEAVDQEAAPLAAKGPTATPVPGDSFEEEPPQEGEPCEENCSDPDGGSQGGGGLQTPTPAPPPADA